MRANYPIIKRRIRGIELVRSARGFSKAEFKEAGFSSISFARKKGILVDELRKTTVPENVEKLKSIANEFSNTKRNKSNLTKEKDQKMSTVVNNKPNEATIKEND
jgi:ribosomal protein L13E